MGWTPIEAGNGRAVEGAGGKVEEGGRDIGGGVTSVVEGFGTQNGGLGGGGLSRENSIQNAIKSNRRGGGDRVWRDTGIGR